MKVRAVSAGTIYGKFRYPGEEFDLIDLDMGYWTLLAKHQFSERWMEKVVQQKRRGRPRKVKT